MARPKKQKEATPEVKTEEVVNEVVETAAEVTEATENVPAEEKVSGEKPKRGRRKATEAKTETKKAAKPGRPAKQKTEKKVEATVYVQYSGRTFETDKLLEAAKEAWIAKGRRTTSIKSLELYINVTENKAYPVINGEPQDGFDC